MISLQQISKHYHQTIAVDDLTLSVPEGKTLVLLGTSGSGKTTTLRMINRLVEPSSGTISISGENILLQPPQILRRSIGYVLQGYGLFPHYTVAENIAIVPKLLEWSSGKIANRVDEVLHKLHLPPEKYRDLYPSSLSGGQMQRVGLARALAAHPPVLLMDEPFGALDPVTRLAIRKEFTELDERKKKTIVIVTHDVPEAFAMGDIIGLMDKGRLQQVGTPLDFLFRPANQFVSDFLQHHRLQLEWQTCTLKSIWSALPDAPFSTPAAVSSQQTTWEALELLTENSSPLFAYDTESVTTKEITLGRLQSAIHQKKAKASL